ncbi:hypothetical protein D6777_02595 [Candidatus Woesearchaeota archaeon]|nr:MAG: hypothetical protein D6777_02595 [Candidatus Woesearchaeota archaeon]
MEFKVKKKRIKEKISNPVLIEGLPGIGNVGKVAVDFIIDSLKAKKVIEIYSYHFPHSVFINEKNMVELPVIEIYHKKVGKKDFLFLAGDVQPVDEYSCYKFCDLVLDILEEYGGKEVITLGGIGLQTVPNKPKVYVTGTKWDFVKTFRGASNKIYGVVGPIVGVSGVLLGLAKLRKIPSASLLAQTFGHPAYLGIKGARETLKILDKKYKLKLDISQLDEEIEELEDELKSKTQQLMDMKMAEKGKIAGQPNYFG